MIWVEILSPHQEIAARFPVAGSQLSIGRGYDNDVIIDDPYVAAQHLRVFRDDTGVLVVEDLGSINGMFLDAGKIRQTRLIVDGNRLIRVGQTWLRIRETNHRVAPERILPRRRRTWSVLLAVLLGLAIWGVEALEVWLTQISEPRPSSYLQPLLIVTAGLVAWVGLWSLLSRIFSGHGGFLRHLIIASLGVLAFLVYQEFAQLLAFAWTSPVASTYQYVAFWSILAAVCFFHLRDIGHSRLWLKGALVSGLLAIAIGLQTLLLSEALSVSGRQLIAHRLLPPVLRLVPLRDPDSFFGDVAKLREDLDRDRTRARAEDGGRPGAP
jgi:hypothetical protein